MVIADQYSEVTVGIRTLGESRLNCLVVRLVRLLGLLNPDIALLSHRLKPLRREVIGRLVAETDRAGDDCDVHRLIPRPATFDRLAGGLRVVTAAIHGGRHGGLVVRPTPKTAHNPSYRREADSQFKNVVPLDVAPCLPSRLVYHISASSVPCCYCASPGSLSPG